MGLRCGCGWQLTSERDALVLLFQATRGQWWKDDNGWKTESRLLEKKRLEALQFTELDESKWWKRKPTQADDAGPVLERVPLHRWHGVELEGKCSGGFGGVGGGSEAKNVRALKLSDNDLTGFGAKAWMAVGHLPCLKELDFTLNRSRGCIFLARIRQA